MRKFCIYLLIIIIISAASPSMLGNRLDFSDNVYALPEFMELSNILSSVPAKDLTWCIAFIKSSEMDSRQIADVVLNWNPDKRQKLMTPTLKNKIMHLVDGLKSIGYESLIRYIDIIKRSPLNAGQITILLNETRERKGVTGR